MATARRFLAVYLVYEVEPLDGAMHSALRHAATSALTNRLVTHPVNIGARDRPAVGTVQALELGGDPDSTTVTADATIDHDGWVSGLILDFKRIGRQWLVSGLS